MRISRLLLIIEDAAEISVRSMKRDFQCWHQTDVFVFQHGDSRFGHSTAKYLSATMPLRAMMHSRFQHADTGRSAPSSKSLETAWQAIRYTNFAVTGEPLRWLKDKSAATFLQLPTASREEELGRGP